MDYYAALLTDRARVDAFRSAIREGVEPGDAVLEIGTGLGTYAFFAADAGAAAVWGIDLGPIVHVASHLARISGREDRVTLLRGRVPDVDLPRLVNVCVFEDFAVRLVSTEIHDLLAAVAAKYLAPNARMVPGAARLCLAPAAGDDLRATLFPGGDATFRAYGLEWLAVLPYLANQPRTLHLRPDQIVGQPSSGAVLPLLPPPGPDLLAVEGEWTFPSPTRVDALALWFDLRMTETTWLSNRPGTGSVWGQVVLPLEPALTVPADTPLHARVAPDRTARGAPGFLSWTAETGASPRRGHEIAGAPAALSDFEASQPRVAP